MGIVDKRERRRRAQQGFFAVLLILFVASMWAKVGAAPALLGAAGIVFLGASSLLAIRHHYVSNAQRKRAGGEEPSFACALSAEALRGTSQLRSGSPRPSSEYFGRLIVGTDRMWWRPGSVAARSGISEHAWPRNAIGSAEVTPAKGVMRQAVLTVLISGESIDMWVWDVGDLQAVVREFMRSGT